MAALVYDKKQLPQVIGLGVLSLGMLGFFGMKMLTPPASQAAAPQTGQAPNASASGSGDSTDASNPAPDAAAMIGASAPSDAMRDPFAEPASVAAAAAPPTPARPGAPGAPGLPGLGQVQPLPLRGASAPPTAWAVTGIVCSDQDPNASLAIFRAGDQRRYVRLGHMVDDNTRLVDIDRGGVTVSRNNSHVRLTLGSAPVQPAGVPAAPTAPGVPGLPADIALPPIPGLSVKPPLLGATSPAAPPQSATQPKPAPPGIPTF